VFAWVPKNTTGSVNEYWSVITGNARVAEPGNTFKSTICSFEVIQGTTTMQTSLPSVRNATEERIDNPRQHALAPERTKLPTVVARSQSCATGHELVGSASISTFLAGHLRFTSPGCCDEGAPRVQMLTSLDLISEASAWNVDLPGGQQVAFVAFCRRLAPN